MSQRQAPDKYIIEWLVDGDASLAFQANRDLLGIDRPDLQAQIAKTGWGQQILAARRPDGHWGLGFYKPYWTATHYTLIDLKNLGVSPREPRVHKSIDDVLDHYIARDGGIGHAFGQSKSDVCINGLFLSYACYFGADENRLRSVIDFLLEMVMEDGGFNCMKNRSGARHSSLHSTLSVLEGFLAYRQNGYGYRGADVDAASVRGREFILLHHLFKSDRTGEIIHKDFLKAVHPARWRYNIFRALDYFQSAKVPYDPRMGDALDHILQKRRADGRWMGAKLPGIVHMVMDPPRVPSRWITLIALRVLKAYGDA